MRTILLILATTSALMGQRVTITGKVVDPNGNAYYNGKVQLVSGNGSGAQSWTVGGTNPVNPTVPISGLDGAGNFSVSLYSTAVIDQQTAQPEWQFSFCSYGSPPPVVCFNVPPLALASTQSITTQINAVPPPMITGSGGGNIPASSPYYDTFYTSAGARNLTGVPPLTYPAILFGVVSNDSTDDTSAWQTALAYVKNIASTGTGAWLQLPCTGMYSLIMGQITWPANVGLIGCGEYGHDVPNPTKAPAGGLDLQYFPVSALQGKINFLDQGNVYWDNVAIKDGSANASDTEPLFYITATNIHMSHLYMSGVGTGYNTQNDAFRFGDAVSASNCPAPGNPPQCFSGFFTSLYDITFDGIRHPMVFGSTANGIIANVLNGTSNNGCSTDGTSSTVCPAFIGNATTQQPSCCNKLDGINFEQGAFCVGGCAHPNYSYIIDLDNFFGTESDLQIAEEDHATAAVHVGTHPGEFHISCHAGDYSGGCTANFLNTSYPGIVEDAVNETFGPFVASRYFYGVHLGTSSTPFTDLNISRNIQSQTSNTDLAGRKAASSNSMSYSFTGTYTNAPVCVVTDDAGGTISSKTVTNTTLTVGTSGASDNVSWVCITKG